jgi:hypothetical protein
MRVKVPQSGDELALAVVNHLLNRAIDDRARAAQRRALRVGKQGHIAHARWQIGVAANESEHMTVGTVLVVNEFCTTEMKNTTVSQFAFIHFAT